MSPLSRRDFLAALGGTALAGGALLGTGGLGAGSLGAGRLGAQQASGSRVRSGAGVLGRGAGRARYEGVGVQLYTVRSMMSESVPDTLAAIAGIGYSEVEFAGLFNTSPRQMRMLLDDHGLTAPSTHLGLEELRGDRLNWNIVAASIMGHEYLTCPYLGGDFRSADGYRQAAEFLNLAGDEATKEGIKIGYHNHDFEFETLGNGETGYEILLAETEPDLVTMQMDLFWTVNAGMDPLAIMRAHPGRFTSVHVKDRTADGAMVAVGDGVIDFSTILAEAAAEGVQHAFVEHDRPEDALASVRTSFGNVSRILSQMR